MRSYYKELKTEFKDSQYEKGGSGVQNNLSYFGQPPGAGVDSGRSNS